MAEVNGQFLRKLTAHIGGSVEEFCEEEGDVTPAELSTAFSIVVHHVIENSDRKIERDVSGK